MKTVYKTYCAFYFLVNRAPVFCVFSLLALAAWHKAAGLVHQGNSDKTVYQTYSTVHFGT